MSSCVPHFRLTDLPCELVHEIFQYLDPVSLIDFSSFNSYFNEIAVETMLDRYEYRSGRDWDGYHLRNFANTIATNYGTRAWCLKHLALRDNWHERISGYDTSLLDKESVLGNANRFGQWLMKKAVGLRTLHVAYANGLKFLDRMPLKLKSLVVRPRGLEEIAWGNERFDEAEYSGRLELDFLPMVLLSNTLERLDLGGEEVSDDTRFVHTFLPITNTSIKDLKLTVGELRDDAIECLLGALKGLEKFTFRTVNLDDTRYRHSTGQLWDNESDVAHLPAISSIGAGLMQISHSLRELRLHRSNYYWYPKLDTLGSLANFFNLEHLEIPATMLLGWNHCEHIKITNPSTGKDPSTLPDLLPANLQTLVLNLEDHHAFRNGASYVLDIVLALKTQSSRFKSLQQVNIGGNMPYCKDCDEFIKENEDLEIMVRNLSIQEGLAIKTAVEDAQFDFRTDWDGVYWDENNWTFSIRQWLFPRIDDDGWSELTGLSISKGAVDSW